MNPLEIAGVVAVFLLGFICGGSKAWYTARRAICEIFNKDWDMYED